MDLSNSGNPPKLLTLNEAALKLGVTEDVLLRWNEHNILKPTITLQGEIGYTQNQIDHFIGIRQIIQNNSSDIQSNSVVSQPTSAAPQYYPTMAAAQIDNFITTHKPPRDYANISKIKPAGDAFVHTPKNSSSWGAKYFTPSNPSTFILSLAVLVIGLFITAFLRPGLQTSKLKLQAEIISPQLVGTKNILPEQGDQNTLPQQQNKIQLISERIDKEKIASPDIFGLKQIMAFANTQYPQTRNRLYSAGSANNADDTASFDAFALTNDSSGNSCPTCTEDDNKIIDENGNIRGDVKTDTLSAVVDRIDDMLRHDSLNSQGADTTGQLIFLTTGAVAALFAFRKKLFAYPIRKSQTAGIQNMMGAQNVLPLQYGQDAPQPQLHMPLRVDQKTDGTVVVIFQGKEFKISKPEMNSESDQFIERLMNITRQDVKEIEYDILRQGEPNLITPLSRLVTRLGFVGLKRDLFFPRTSKSTVLFRKYLTQQDIEAMDMTSEQIMEDLMNRETTRNNTQNYAN